jgi:hypothetical protein
MLGGLADMVTSEALSYITQDTNRILVWCELRTLRASVTRLWIAYHNINADDCELEIESHRRYGPVLRITPTLLLVSDATELPEIYDRLSNKSNSYTTGRFGKTESSFNMR